MTIVEFVDFGCEHCNTSSGPLSEVVRESGDVRLVFKHYPRSASDAARAAFAAHQQGRFWEMHDWLMARQGSTENVADYAEKLGIERAIFSHYFTSREAEEAIAEDRVAGDAARLSGLPTFFVNGRQFVGSFGREEWRQILDDERGFAQSALEQGIHVKSVDADIVRADGTAG